MRSGVFPLFLFFQEGKEACGCPVIPAPFAEMTGLPPIELSLYICQKLIEHILMGLFVESVLFIVLSSASAVLS